MGQQSIIGSIGYGVCPCHTSPLPYNTTILSTPAETTTSAEGANAVVGAIGIATCGHATSALTGSPDVFHQGGAAHRVGDIGANCGNYTMLTGIENVRVNE